MKRKPCLIENCSSCGLRAKVVLCDIAGSELAEFENIKRTLAYGPHQTVFYEGHLCLGLYVLCAGKVKLTRSSTRGRRQIVRILGPGELIEKHVFGERALHEVTCETLEASQVSVIDKERYLAVIHRNPQLAIKLIQLLSNEVGVNMDHLDQFTFKTARERLAGLLLELGDRFGKKNDDHVRVGLTLKREEVAEMAGITVETAIRLLGVFRDEEILTIDGRTITLLNPDRLSRIAQR
ncbi:MAG: Crp/Fnr family transcriptional regulator [Nitrospira sp.]|nr:Crp/Fnr family transcriptional regulator [Nitrospira sp.]ULA59956.1 MAG: Crp/Fnr family transcriptional regulator [Nitrospira sp.]